MLLVISLYFSWLEISSGILYMKQSWWYASKVFLKSDPFGLLEVIFLFFQVDRSLLVTGFGYEHDDAWATNIELFKEFTDVSRVLIDKIYFVLWVMFVSCTLLSLMFIYFCVKTFLLLKSKSFCCHVLTWSLGCKKARCSRSGHVPCSSRNCWSILGIPSKALGYGCWCFGKCLFLIFYKSIFQKWNVL